MKKADLLKRIEELERRVACLEARPYNPCPPGIPYVVPSTTPQVPLYPWVATCGGVQFSSEGLLLLS